MTPRASARISLAVAAFALLATSGCLSCLACTVFASSSEERVLFGSSEDGPVSTPYVWTAMPGRSTHGAVFYGFANGVAQGGMNDQGLCFDVTAVPTPRVSWMHGAHWMRGKWPSTHPLDFCQAALRECSTVAEVRAFLESHVLARITGGQFLFVDRDGHTLFLGIAADGQTTITDGESSPQVLTNFNILAPELGGAPCDRHTAAQRAMDCIADGSLPLSLDTFVDVLRRVHVVDGPSETVYAVVANPALARVHLYFGHDLDTAVVLAVPEISSEMVLIPMADLFH